VVGRGLAEGKLELRIRATGEKSEIDVDHAVASLLAALGR